MMGRFLKSAFAAAVLVGATSAAWATAPLATIDTGRLAGTTSAGVQQFLGIPFAAPPVGELRWKAPQPVAAWTDVRDASKTATRCSSASAGDGPRLVNEDCLYLDVYAPADARPGAKLPVMVFFHGGGNNSGSPDIYDGDRMAAVAHALVVIPAYRLGAFGFLAHPALSAEDQANGSGGYGLLDQVAALQWVQRNAAAFGGDPADVTVTGQSSGGADVCGLMTSPAARGLYNRTIVQSGICQWVSPLATAEKSGADFAAKLGCADPATASACLRKVPAGEIVDKFGSPILAAPWGTGLEPEAPMAAFADGHFTHLPFAIGFTHDEYWSFTHSLYPLGQQKFEAMVKEQFGDRAGKVLGLYPVGNFPHIEYAFGGIQTDVDFVCPALAIADAASKYVPVSVYEFSDRTAPAWKSLGAPSHIPPGYNPAASHTAELEYLYAYKAAVGPLNAEQGALADQLVKLWVGFGRDAAGAWPGYSAADRQVLELRLPEQGGIKPVTSVFDDHKCGFWNQG